MPNKKIAKQGIRKDRRTTDTQEYDEEDRGKIIFSMQQKHPV